MLIIYLSKVNPCVLGASFVPSVVMLIYPWQASLLTGITRNPAKNNTFAAD
jgi:hypothetical protein